jgi:hypothetical protein
MDRGDIYRHNDDNSLIVCTDTTPSRCFLHVIDDHTALNELYTNHLGWLGTSKQRDDNLTFVRNVLISGTSAVHPKLDGMMQAGVIYYDKAVLSKIHVTGRAGDYIDFVDGGGRHGRIDIRLIPTLSVQVMPGTVPAAMIATANSVTVNGADDTVYANLGGASAGSTVTPSGAPSPLNSSDDDDDADGLLYDDEEYDEADYEDY